MPHFSTSPRLPLLATLAAVALSNTVAGHAAWENAWRTSAPPALSVAYPAMGPNRSIAFAADGDIVLGGQGSEFDYQVTRLGSDGTLRWSIKLPDLAGAAPAQAWKTLATDDGGAVVSLSLTEFPTTARISPDGRVLWERPIGTSNIREMTGNRIAARTCSAIYVFDGLDGSIRWKSGITTQSHCDLQVDSNSMIYVTSVAAGTIRLVKLDSNGNALWDVPSGFVEGTTVSVVAVDATQTYLLSDSELRAYRQTDGSQTWTLPVSAESTIVMSADATPEPIVLDSTTARRIAADTGSERWSAAIVSPFRAISAGSSLLIQNASSLASLDAGSGDQNWSSALPASDGAGHTLEWQAIGIGADNAAISVATLPRTKLLASTAFMLPIGLSSGASLPPLSIEASSSVPEPMTVSAGDAIISAAYSGSAANGSEIRVRSVDASTGATNWERVEALALGAAGFYGEGFPPSVAVSADVVAVVATLKRHFSQGQNEGALEVFLLDRTTGTVLWSKTLHETDQGESATTGPRIDTDGNPYVDIRSSEPCGIGSRCNYHRLYKFARVDGSVAWTRETVSDYFDLVGNDVLMPGPFEGSTATLKRLAGSDGSELWSTDELTGETTIFTFQATDPQHVILFGASHRAKIDVTSGATIWSVDGANINCPSSCFSYDRITLVDGDIVSVGEGGGVPYLSRYHSDGSGILDEWTLPPNNPILRSTATRVRELPSGELAVAMGRSVRSTDLWIGFLARVDASSGAILSQQARDHGAMWLGPLGTFAHPIVVPDTLHSIMQFGRFDAGPEGVTQGVAWVDTTIENHGDLFASLVGDAHVNEDGTLGFRATVSFHGDAPLSGATLLVSLPLHDGKALATCSVIDASHCVVDDRYNNLVVTFDVQPGGSIELSGQIDDLRGPERTWVAVGTHGPTSLDESDTTNNFARIQVDRSLFRNGFESP